MPKDDVRPIRIRWHVIAKPVAHNFETEIFSDSVFHADHESDGINWKKVLHKEQN